MKVFDKQYLSDTLDLAYNFQFWCVSWPHDGQGREKNDQLYFLVLAYKMSLLSCPQSPFQPR